MIITQPPFSEGNWFTSFYLPETGNDHLIEFHLTFSVDRNFLIIWAFDRKFHNQLIEWLFQVVGQVRLGQVRLGQARLGQVRLGQVRLFQVRLFQVRLGKVGFLGQVFRLGYFRLGQARLGQVLSLFQKFDQLKSV